MPRSRRARRQQWTAWLKAMGSPAWGADPRFATKADRVANWDALHALMSAMEPAARQAMDRRHRAARACAELSAARAVAEHLDIAAAAASRLLRGAHDLAGQADPGAGPAVRPDAVAASGRKQRAPAGSDAAVRRPRARFQLGDRRSDDDALPRGDGRGGHQGRGARPRRPGPRVGTAHRARPGEEGHRARPEEAAKRSRSRARWPRSPTC